MGNNNTHIMKGNRPMIKRQVIKPRKELVLTNITTKEHYDKYSVMVKKAGLSLKDSALFGTKELIKSKFISDPNLNNIPLSHFDALFAWNRRLPNGPKSLSENTCMYKHLLIYEVLNAKPIFKKR